MEHRSEQCNELFGALAKAQAEMPMAELNASNPFFKSKYTDLAEIVRVSRPSLTKYGLSVMQQLVSKDDSNILITILAHSSGQFIESSMKLNPVKTDIQSLGSYISYLKRYQMASLIGCVSSDELDDDGESAMQEHRKPVHSIQSQYISDAQLKLLEDKMKQNPEIAQQIPKKFNIVSRKEILKTQFNDILKEFDK